LFSAQLGRQSGFESLIDGEDGVGAGQLQESENTFGGSDETKLAAVRLHRAVEDHEKAETCAVEEFNAGEFEDEFVDAFGGDVCDL